MTPPQHPKDLFAFKPEAPETPAGKPATEAWQILSVDDNSAFQESLSHVLSGINIFGKPIELTLATSMAEAAQVLTQQKDFAVIMVDVVMETDDAGLRLVKAIREVLGLQEPRILLLTGEPGFAPLNNTMEEYDLTDYCLKSDLERRGGIKTILTAAIRNYTNIASVNAARRGLQLIIESSNHISRSQSLSETAVIVLREITKLLNIPEEGIVAASFLPNHSPVIIAAAGKMSSLVNNPLEALPDSTVRAAIASAIAQKESLITPQYQVLYMAPATTAEVFVTFVASARPLTSADQELLAVFCANAGTGFSNIALISRLDRAAYEDPLLRIPNTAALLRDINRVCFGGASAADHRLMLIDLDHFSGFTETFGTQSGHTILEALIPLIKERFPPPCFVARVFSDMFAVFGPDTLINNQKALDIFHAPIPVGREKFHFTACCGYAQLDPTQMDSGQLLLAAKSALRQAKKHGPGSAAVFDRAMESEVVQRFTLMTSLTKAIEAEELFLLYQPQIELKTGRVIGAEALLRWQTDEGFIPPDQFIPMAELSTHIHDIGTLIVRQALQTLHTLAAAGLEHLTVSINISPRQFESHSLIDDLLTSLAEANIPSSRLGIEVTETAAVENFHLITEELKRYRNHSGIVAIDDFGTGHASLQHASLLPADHIKIDRVFVSRIGEHNQHEAILRFILELAHSIGVELIAEGVETQEQADWLTQHGCQYAQGWHFGKPMSVDDLIQLCLKNNEQP